MDKKTKKYCPIKHYTSIEFLWGILNSKSLFLSDPEKWPDKNDVASVRAFCRKKGEGVARIVCFTKEETIHHWKDGTKKGNAKKECCINFDENVLFRKLNKSFLKGDVEYKSLSGDNGKERITATYLKKINADKLPFLKRYAYNCENEYRVVWFGQESKAAKNAVIRFDIRKAIKSVSLAPDLKNLENVRKILEEKYSIKVNLSRIEGSENWIRLFNNC